MSRFLNWFRKKDNNTLNEEIMVETKAQETYSEQTEIEEKTVSWQDRLKLMNDFPENFNNAYGVMPEDSNKNYVSFYAKGDRPFLTGIAEFDRKANDQYTFDSDLDTIMQSLDPTNSSSYSGLGELVKYAHGAIIGGQVEHEEGVRIVVRAVKILQKINEELGPLKEGESPHSRSYKPWMSKILENPDTYRELVSIE
ncbi:MAG: hypothetical protein GOU98_00025 [Candidatus Altiarchaeota archaeon]|nr:hypothetical protein [Candidatus Altiarchaeota archaeon]